MKIKNILGVFLASIIVMSCKSPDDLVRTDSDTTATLIVKGSLVENDKNEYDGIIDEDERTITIQVPYYISDTKELQGDLTKMKLLATLPVGAQFQPSLSGIHDLAKGFQSTLISESGTKTKYTFKAEYVKSKLSKINKVELTEYSRSTIRIVEPTMEGGVGKIIIYKTSSALDGDVLKSAEVSVSPWAKIESIAMDPVTGIIDLSNMPEITVIAQNGKDKTTYQSSIEYPEILSQGIGYIASLFGFQVYTDDSHGFEVGANRTMAVVDNHLIISNSSNYNKMLVLDRYNGKTLSLKVNTTGLAAGRSIHAITNDDAGHLVAMTYTSTRDNTLTDPLVSVWVWKNGISNTPTRILHEDINGPVFDQAPMGVNGNRKVDIGRVIKIKGDITSGKAVLTTCSAWSYRPVFISFADGVLQGKAYVEWAGGVISMSDCTKFVPLTTEQPFSYIWTTANEENVVTFIPKGTGVRNIDFVNPTSHWWGWQGKTKGMDYIEFNGTSLLAVQNGHISEAHRLYVADITSSPQNSSFSTGFLFDSQQGNTAGTGGIPGTGYIVTGYTSPLPFEAGKNVLGANVYGTGDVIFGKSDDDNAVQVYMLTTDQGLIAFELTKYSLN